MPPPASCQIPAIGQSCSDLLATLNSCWLRAAYNKDTKDYKINSPDFEGYQALVLTIISNTDS